MNKKLHILAWVLQGLLVGLFLQSVAVKVMGSPQTVYIFEKLEMGAMGRALSALLEIMAIVGLLVPRFFREAAVLSILLMAAGVFFHLTELGINVAYDEGLRFYLMCFGLVLSIAVFAIRTHLAEVLYKRGKLD